MIPNTSGLNRVRLISLVSCIIICFAGCRHRAADSNLPQPPTMGATLVVEFVWVSSPEDNLDTSRTVILSGRQVSTARDSRFVSCFGPGKKIVGCQGVGEFSTTSAQTPGLEFDGTETITTAQPGGWEIYSGGESSGGVNASQVCSVNVEPSRLVTVRITLGVDAGCAVQ